MQCAVCGARYSALNPDLILLRNISGVPSTSSQSNSDQSSSSTIIIQSSQPCEHILCERCLSLAVARSRLPGSSCACPVVINSANHVLKCPSGWRSGPLGTQVVPRPASASASSNSAAIHSHFQTSSSSAAAAAAAAATSYTSRPSSISVAISSISARSIDPQFDAEMAARREVHEHYFRRRESFSSDIEYNDYLEEVEDMVQSLMFRRDEESVRAKMRQFERSQWSELHANKAIRRSDVEGADAQVASERVEMEERRRFFAERDLHEAEVARLQYAQGVAQTQSAVAALAKLAFKQQQQPWGTGGTGPRYLTPAEMVRLQQQQPQRPGTLAGGRAIPAPDREKLAAMAPEDLRLLRARAGGWDDAIVVERALQEARAAFSGLTAGSANDVTMSTQA